MSEYKVWIEYGYHAIFSMMVIALSVEDAVRIAMAEGVPASFASEKMTRLSVSLELDGVCCNQTRSDCKLAKKDGEHATN